MKPDLKVDSSSVASPNSLFLNTGVMKANPEL